MSIEGRLVKIEDKLRAVGCPPGCRWVDGHCATYEIISAKPGEAAEPIPFPASDTCPRCGRSRFERLYVVIRDDGEPLPALPDFVGVDPAN